MPQKALMRPRFTDPMFRELARANYLVDFFSEAGVLFRSERILAQDDNDAEIRARRLANFIRPAFFKIKCLKKSDKLVIDNERKGTI